MTDYDVNYIFEFMPKNVSFDRTSKGFLQAASG